MPRKPRKRPRSSKIGLPDSDQLSVPVDDDPALELEDSVGRTLEAQDDQKQPERGGGGRAVHVLRQEVELGGDSGATDRHQRGKGQEGDRQSEHAACDRDVEQGAVGRIGARGEGGPAPEPVGGKAVEGGAANRDVRREAGERMSAQPGPDPAIQGDEDAQRRGEPDLRVGRIAGRDQQGGGADEVDAQQKGRDMIERAHPLARGALLLLVVDALEILRELTRERRTFFRLPQIRSALPSKPRHRQGPSRSVLRFVCLGHTSVSPS
jgi:hypothetical protein